MNYSVHGRCGCTGDDGKQLGQDCPLLWRKGRNGEPTMGKDGAAVWVGARHGTAGWAARVPTSSGEKLVKRFGFATKTEAENAAEHADRLLDLAADDASRKRVGDLIAGAKRGAALPSEQDVARRLGVGLDPSSAGVSFGEARHAWLAGKKRLRASAAERLELAGKHWILPALEDVPLKRLNGAHVAEVFTRTDRINKALAVAQKAAGSRSWIKVEDDVRTRPQVIGIASQHRVYAALREFCNFELKKTRRLSYNPVYAVELEPEVTPEAKRWSAAQAREFLSFTRDEPLGLAFRIVLLRGARRGEALGLRWQDSDLDAGYVAVKRAIVLVRNAITESTPKTRTGYRLIWLDAETIRLLKELRKIQLKARLKAGKSWQDNDLVFCKDDGTPFKPDSVTRRFKRLGALAGLPVITLHEGRHSAASLARDAEVDPEIRRKTLGHADAAMTSHYTHIEAEAHKAAAEAAAKLSRERHDARVFPERSHQGR
jgi:integrase